MKLYAIRSKSTDELLGVSIQGNGPDADFCNSYDAELDLYNEVPWVTPIRELATRLIQQDSVDWYNSSIEHPMVPDRFKGDLEVVEFVCVG
jgi:hypothetical protein